METPSLEILRHMEMGEVVPRVRLLQQIAEANWNDRLTASDLLVEVAKGKISVWQVGEAGSGVALLRIEQSPTRRVLLLDGLAGHNVMTKGQAIGRDLETLARFWNCSSIETSAADLRWNFVAKRLGFEAVSVVYERKL